MKKIFLVGLVLFLAAVAIGCTDAKLSHYAALGKPADITCYSGGKMIYHGKSTGKVMAENQSDGWFFKEEGTGRQIRVSGDCVISN